MITKGSKIQLVKPMGVFDNIGEVCEVVNVTEDGVITFRFGNYHLGCMSYDEFGKYFIHYKETKKTPKRKWSNWEKDMFIYFGINGKKTVTPVKYRNNGKILDLRTDWDDKPNLRAKAFCNKTDEFDSEIGLDIADARMQIKLMKKELEDLIDTL